MNESPIDNLKISKVTDSILLIKQIKTPSYFSCSDGLLLLPREGRNKDLIVLDLNIEPKYIQFLIDKYGKASYYINSHGHMDHIAHVHAWEKNGAEILGPEGGAKGLLSLEAFYKCFEFSEGVSFTSIEKLAKLNLYNNCNNVRFFKPGEILQLEGLKLQTIPLVGHSKSHVGFFLEKEKVFHISCLGFDIPSPDTDGFGPWYGFKQCSLDMYLKDIDTSEKLFLEKAHFLTSSHSYIVRGPEKLPFTYMRRKIHSNQERIKNALADIDQNLNLQEKVDKLLIKDLFFPKRKMEGFLKEIYIFWEYWIIKNHLLQGLSI